ncbi:hypothetical protein P1X15_03140 [Runella sp. MFBS21]|uniref:hypothetical protein n=1 Tax=Runella sp. MFBS21 TaxID=3034018 RepID=UPI0023F888DE|nr:hypothetical protein [Runella sp. MFBS21]MDF7816568.1 hypothetical protein [Runella sp. MFBS21]
MKTVRISIERFVMMLAIVGLFVAAITRENAPSLEKSQMVLADSVDAETGLALDPNFAIIKAQCTGCHSPKLILQHRFTRDEWLSKIRWMQRNHKLWDLGETEKTVLDYLAKHYAPNQAAYSRREPLRNIKWYKLEQ